MLSRFAMCHFLINYHAEHHNAKCRYADCRYAECRNAGRHHAECPGDSTQQSKGKWRVGLVISIVYGMS